MNHPPNSQMRQESSKRRWARAIVDRLVELVIVFVGVYAAFMLNAHQGHEQQRQRRDQILSYLEKEVTASAANLKQVTANYDRRMNEFTSQVAKGEMPDITPISGRVATTQTTRHGSCKRVDWSCWRLRQSRG